MLESVPDGVGGRGGVRRTRPADDDVAELDATTSAISAADRQILQEALLQLGEIDVEHHDDEQEQHRDRADIDDDQDHRQELGAHQQEQARRVDEGEDQEQHRMHGIAAMMTASAEAISIDRENPEEYVLGHRQPRKCLTPPSPASGEGRPSPRAEKAVRSAGCGAASATLSRIPGQAQGGKGNRHR